MKKSFKKAIAVMLATLMIVCSLPFTAFAAPGDYNPNVTLRFGTFYDNENSTWTDYTVGGASGCAASGIFDAPVTWDQKNGTLTLEAADTEAISASWAMDPLAEDYTYGVGDFFTVTVIWENITKCSLAAIRLNYTDNIEPAGLYSYKAGKKTAYKIETVAEADAAGHTLVTGGNLGVKEMSTGAFYSTMDTLMDTSYVDETPSTVNTSTVREIYDCHSSTGSQNLKDNTISGVTNPETGALEYNYSDKDVMIGQTFAFKITGAGPIDFTLTDPNNTVVGDYTGGFYVADQIGDGNTRDMYTTYAPNFWNQDLVAEDPENVPERAGSRKITYLGTNIHNGSTSTDTEFTFTPADGRTAVKVTAADSAAALASAPANSAAVTATNNNGTHTTTTYSGWTLGEDGVTFTEASSASTVDCTLNYTSNGDAKCEIDGTKTATCPDCGYVSTVTDTGSALVHDYSGTPVSNNDGTHTYTCANGCGVPKNEACSYTSEVTKDPTLTQTGIRTFTCTKCGHTYTEDIPATGSSYTFVMADGSKTFVTAETAESALASAPAHSPAKVVDNKNGTHTTTTYDGWSLNAETKTYTETSSASTVDCTLNYTSNGDAECEIDGTKTATCPTCGYVSTVTDTGSALVHDMQLKTAEVPATCETPGTTAVYECANGCGKTEGGTTISALGHDMQLKTAEVPATCETPGTTAVYECANGCGKTEGGTTISALGHDMQKTADEIPATFDAPGKTAVYTCANGCGKTEGGDEIAQLVGVTVTVAATDMGTTTLNGDDATNGVATKVLKNSKITLTATAVGGAEFVGWAIGNKIVSEAATFTTTAIADVTYTPVFTTTEASTFTVVFVDSYGNVISTQDVATGTDIVEPEAPARIGYTFKEWSLTAAQIDDLATGTTIVAKYNKDAATTYTVTAAGCEITVNGKTVQDTATGITYDTQVTVKASGATTWKINGAPVAYGDTYTFYVGSDVTVVPTFETGVTAKPTVAAVSVDPIAGTNKAAYLATYSMEPGYTEISHGFVFGKNVDASEISLDNVNGTTIKAYYCKTTSKQFSLNISTSTPSAVVTAKAFLAYVDNSTGKTVVIYAEPQSHTFA